MSNLKLLPDYKINFQVKDIEKINYNHSLHDIPFEWRITKGQGVKIAVLDTGLPTHDNVKDKIISYKNFTDSDDVIDKDGHSTFCCGIICAESINENNGITGIAPKAELYIGKVISDSGNGNDEWLAEAIYWCIENKIDIINMSLGAPSQFEHKFPKTRQAVLAAYEKNIYMFAAAGNEGGSNVNIPGKWNEVFCIGAIDKNQQHAKFSNTGKEIDFSGVGVDVISTYLENQFVSLSGTSMATPDISGIAALILSEHKNNNCKCTPINNFWDMRSHLIKICTDLGTDGHDLVFGFGNPVFSKPSDNFNINDMGGIDNNQKNIQKSLWNKFLNLFRIGNK